MEGEEAFEEGAEGGVGTGAVDFEIEFGVGGAAANEVGLAGAIDGDQDVGAVVCGERVNHDADAGDGGGAAAFADDFELALAGGAGVDATEGNGAGAGGDRFGCEAAAGEAVGALARIGDGVQDDVVDIAGAGGGRRGFARLAFAGGGGEEEVEASLAE